MLCIHRSIDVNIEEPYQSVYCGTHTQETEDMEYMTTSNTVCNRPRIVEHHCSASRLLTDCHALGQDSNSIKYLHQIVSSFLCFVLQLQIWDRGQLVSRSQIVSGMWTQTQTLTKCQGRLLAGA